MIEAISIVLFLGFLAASIASIVGVIIGLRQKGWRTAILAGSTTGALLILFVIAASLSNFEDSDPDAAQGAPVAVPAAPMPTAIPEPTVIPEPTAIPEPTSTTAPSAVTNLGIERDEVEERFERHFESEGLEFGTISDKNGKRVSIGMMDSARMMVIMRDNFEDELESAMVTFTVKDLSSEDSKAIAESMSLLAALIVPNWDRETGISEMIERAQERKDSEIVHDGKLIEFVFDAEGGGTVFAIRTEQTKEAVEQASKSSPEPTAESSPSTVLERFQASQAPTVQTESAPVAERPSYGLGFTRGNLKRRLAEFGYSYATEDFCPEQCTYLSSDLFDMNVVIWLHGPDSNIDKVRVEGNLLTDPEETGLAMAHLLQVVLPESSEQVNRWLQTDVMDALDSAGGQHVIETAMASSRQVEAYIVLATGKIILSITPRG